MTMRPGFLEFDIVGEETVGGDNDVDEAVFDIFENSFLVSGALKPR